MRTEERKNRYYISNLENWSLPVNIRSFIIGLGLQDIVAEDKKTDETECESENQCSTNTKNSPTKVKSEGVEQAFGNDSTVYDESDDSCQEWRGKHARFK